MPRSTTSVGLQPSGYRLRRIHEKSRNGCLPCKQQRKKCDESRPSCSRCVMRKSRCRYPSHDNVSGEPPSGDSLAPNVHVPLTSPMVIVPAPASPDIPASDHVPAPNLSHVQQPLSSTLSPEEQGLVWRTKPPGPLDATELALLAHYLMHTSHTIPFDELDHYALSVGVPNLAFKCNVVMSSLIALAAACKAHDIAKQNPTPLDHQILAHIGELLALGDRHHSDSLRHISVSMQKADSYDHLLANAALMVLYASASHSIRVFLAATAKQRDWRLPRDILPQNSQWISFTRAAHTASTAVLNHIINGPDTPGVDPPLMSPGTASCNKDVLAPEDGPTENTKRLFLPLVASTYIRALESLRRRAESTATFLKQSDQPISDTHRLDASLETISILENCASTALLPRENNPSVDAPKNPLMSFDELSRVSSWVARYMISVTSIQSPRVLRRIIMSFLNKAPAEFLSLVQSVLDSPSVEARAERWMTQDSPGSEEPSLSATHLLALDIFAHWLVLLMLLDGVWWIGDIGQWELGQIVSLMKTQDLMGQLVGTGETWWPESMYLVKRELAPNTRY
ncbi:putative C6 transcription factor [Aspergillus taichungensis]|uniref:Putative C6 transcription factor n=1 Tax=Aspergillus taichungensis TaxID=482145 RepID=A0A2J5I9Y5_9EURO|nr:putative C6 transcription factor [Aspergillus taichungensis]